MKKDIDKIIVSSRIRLARNIQGCKFDSRELERDFFVPIAETIQRNNPTFEIAKISDAKNATLFKALSEQHLISHALLENTHNGMLVASNKSGAETIAESTRRICVMLGEEDHIRIQCIELSLNLAGAYKIAKKLSSEISSEHAFAKDSEFGHLTRCVTNVGTGMRASVMVFLPALTISGRLAEIFAKLRTEHITIRGVYGEGTESGGNMYQISNQATITWKEEEIISTVTQIAENLSRQELVEQAKIFAENPDMIVDGVLRSFGLLTNAHMLSSDEAVNELVSLKLGTNLGIIKFKNNRIIDDLFFIIQPATIAQGKTITAIERDKLRAKRIREILLATRVK